MSLKEAEKDRIEQDEAGGGLLHGHSDWWLLFLALILAGLLGWRGCHWGLPSEERNRLYFADGRVAERAPKLTGKDIEKSWEEYPDFVRGAQRRGALPRWAFNPIRSYHPDEYVVLKSLAAMNPRELNLFPGFFGWPALYFYIVGAELQVASWAGLLELVRDLTFYFSHPEKLAQMYRAGRLLTWLFGFGTIIVLFLSLRRLYDSRVGALAAFLLAVNPLFSINSRYMTADVPMLFWMGLAFYFSVRLLSNMRWRWYFLAGCAVGLATATRYQGVLAAFCVIAAHLFQRGAISVTPLRRLFHRRLWLSGATALVSFLILNPYLLARPGQFWREIAGEVAGSHGGAFARFWQPLLFAECTLGLLLSASAALAFIWLCLRRTREDAMLLLSFIPPLLLLILQKPAMARYFMPALFLPVVLSARGMMLWHKETTGRARLAVAVLAVAVTGETLARSSAFALLSSMDDTRTEAGRWIADNVPEKSLIGVLSEPWQFELPPMDMERYRVEVIGMNPLRLREVRPEFFIFSELQLPPLAVRGPLEPKEAEFWEILRGNGEYRLIAEFSRRRPTLFRQGPHDLHYVSPAIQIYRRVGE